MWNSSLPTLTISVVFCIITVLSTDRLTSSNDQPQVELCKTQNTELLHVLSLFKKLHRSREHIFQGDKNALNVVRGVINGEFRKHKDETDEGKIEELMAGALDAENVFRTQIIQAKRTEQGNYKLRITKDTKMHDNIPFDPDYERPKRRGGRSKCDDTPKPKPDS